MRSYALFYKEGAFKKSLLDRVVQYGSNGTEFNRHSFAYYDEARYPDGSYHGFAGSTNWSVGSDSVSTLSLMGNGSVSALGGVTGNSSGGGIYIGIGTVGNTSSKGETGGLKIGFSQSDSDTLLAMADLDGDGLPDKVFKKVTETSKFGIASAEFDLAVEVFEQAPVLTVVLGRTTIAP